MKKEQLLKYSIALLFIIAAGTTVNAQTDPINITTTAVPFLRIAPDAAAGGMGDVGVATKADANAIFYNLAKTPFAEDRTQVGINYIPWMREVTSSVYMVTLAGYHRFDTLQAISAGFRYFNMGDLPISDNNGVKLQTVHPTEFAVDIAYSRKLSERFAIGIGLRYINSSLVTGNIEGNNYKAATSVAANIGLFYNGAAETGKGFSAGLSFSNLGKKISYTDNTGKGELLPANLGLGVAYTLIPGNESKLQLGLDINKLMVPEVSPTADGMNDYYNTPVINSWGKSFSDADMMIGAGAEYSYHKQFFARAGYFREPQKMGGRKGLTAGLGYKYQSITLNFSYLAPSGSSASKNPLSNTIRLGLLFGQQ